MVDGLVDGLDDGLVDGAWLSQSIRTCCDPWDLEHLSVDLVVEHERGRLDVDLVVEVAM